MEKKLFVNNETLKLFEKFNEDVFDFYKNKKIDLFKKLRENNINICAEHLIPYSAYSLFLLIELEIIIILCEKYGGINKFNIYKDFICTFNDLYKIRNNNSEEESKQVQNYHCSYCDTEWEHEPSVKTYDFGYIQYFCNKFCYRQYKNLNKDKS